MLIVESLSFEYRSSIAIELNEKIINYFQYVLSWVAIKWVKLILKNSENIVDRSRSFDNEDDAVNNDDDEDYTKNPENSVFEWVINMIFCLFLDDKTSKTSQSWDIK